MVDNTRSGQAPEDANINVAPAKQAAPQAAPAVSRIALLISFAAGAFATWIIMNGNLGL